MVTRNFYVATRYYCINADTGFPVDNSCGENPVPVVSSTGMCSSGTCSDLSVSTSSSNLIVIEANPKQTRRTQCGCGESQEQTEKWSILAAYFYTKSCSFNITLETDNPCSGHGQLQIDYTCKCDKGWLGEYCHLQNLPLIAGKKMIQNKPFTQIYFHFRDWRSRTHNLQFLFDYTSPECGIDLVMAMKYFCEDSAGNALNPSCDEKLGIRIINGNCYPSSVCDAMQRSSSTRNNFVSCLLA